MEDPELMQSALSDLLFGPIAFATLPVVSNIPLFNPILELLERKIPAAEPPQLRTALVMVTLFPTI